MNVDTTLAELVLTIGGPVLVCLYLLEGLFIGKLLHPSILFILYVVVTEPSVLVLIFVAAGCVLAATIGQWVLYQGFTDDPAGNSRVIRAIPYLGRVPTIVRNRIGTRRMALINRQFDRYGATAICISNATPGLRGLMAVIAGLNGYSERRFVLLSTLGNAIYMVILVVVATGFVELVDVFVESQWL